jgi:type IV secretion system protein VirB2
MKKLFSTRRGAYTSVASLFFCAVAHAQGGPNGGLPWEGPLSMIAKSLTGNVAKAIGVIALAVSGAMLAFGGEMSEFTKRIMMVVMALSVMLLAGQFMSQFGFG